LEEIPESVDGVGDLSYAFYLVFPSASRFHGAGYACDAGPGLSGKSIG
jgi:hypothetical protein